MAEYKGIDVAQWQGTINWTNVRKAGIQFAILKISKKANNIEPMFETNYAGATKNGILPGGYRYVYATNQAMATAEANAMVQILKGREMPYGIWLDMEDASIKFVGKKMLTGIIDTEAKILQAAGYKVGIYCNRDWYLNVLEGTELAKKYPFWIARYPSNDTGVYNANSTLAPKTYAKAWQYSSKGKVSGITGNVDMDVAYVDIPSYFGSTKKTTSTQTVTTNGILYYPKYNGTSSSIVTALGAVGEKDTSLAHRKVIAKANAIQNYSGTTAQNTNMLTLLKAGKLIKP